MQGSPVRLYTVAEANAFVPTLEARHTEVQGHVRKARALADQVADLEIVWGSKLLADDCPGRAEYLRYREELGTEEKSVDEILRKFREEGIEVKDVITGLTDFYARRGQEIVYLCWKPGEREVGWWHTLQAGFAGRQPIEKF